MHMETQLKKIIFTSSLSNPGPGDWLTIEFDGTETELVINNSEIRYAQIGITINGLGRATILNTRIESCSEAGIKTIGMNDVHITNNFIRSVRFGIQSIDGPGTKISGVDILNNIIDSEAQGIYILIDEVYNAYMFNYRIIGNSISSPNNAIDINIKASDPHGVSNLYNISISNNEVYSGGVGIEIYVDGVL